MPNIEFISSTALWESTSNSDATDIVVSGNYAYICWWNVLSPFASKIYIVDVSDKYNPLLASFIDLSGPLNYATECFVKDDILYLVHPENGTSWYDVSDPYNPTQIYSLPINIGGGGIYVKNNYAYILGASRYAPPPINFPLYIYYVLDPYAPVQLSVTMLTSGITPLLGTSIYVSGNYAYITGYYTYQKIGIRLVICDISNPFVPIILSATDNTDFRYASYITVVGNYAYIFVDPIGLYAEKRIVIYDISNPLSPIYISSINSISSIPHASTTTHTNTFAIDDNVLYFPDLVDQTYSYFFGFSVYDISDVYSPLFDGYVHTNYSIYYPDNVSNVYISDSYLYTVGHDSNFGIYKLDHEEPPSVIDYLTIPLINQKHQNLLPFSLISEQSNTNSSDLTFTIDSLNNKYLNVDNVINRNNEYLTASYVLTNDTYVPETEDAQYKHQSEFYVDIISEDLSGLRDIRMHAEPNAYNFEKVDNAFIIPKFTWDNLSFSNSSTTTATTTIGFLNNIWIGTENGQLEQINYNYEFAANNYSTNLSSYIRKILFSDFNSKAYVSTNDNVLVYNIDHYIDSFDIILSKSLTNDDNTLIVLDDSVNNKIWGVRSYSGNVVEYNSDTLAIEKIHSGFDAPFKILKSSLHNAYFIAGSHILWKIKDDVITSVYEINDYRIADFDISDKGEICLLLEGNNDDIIRILSNNLYSFVLNKIITNANLKYCKYCGQGIFYILSEQDTNSTSLLYDASHWIFDSNSGKLEEMVISKGIFTTVTTTTVTPTTKTIDVIYPIGGESFEIGKAYELKWLSNEADSTFVKIELYQKEYLYGVIADRVANNGIYNWKIPLFIEEGEEYKLKITLLSSNPSPDNEGLSANNFSILSSAVTTSTTSTLPLPIITSSVGISYDDDNQQIIIVLNNGTLLIFSLLSRETFGMLDFGISDVSAVGMGRSTINELDKQSKIRIFVGSSSGLSDMWDGGIIETSSTSCYYGNGNNLVPGNSYFVGLQIYSDKEGWGALNIREFIMPK